MTSLKTEFLSRVELDLAPPSGGLPQSRVMTMKERQPRRRGRTAGRGMTSPSEIKSSQVCHLGSSPPRTVLINVVFAALRLQNCVMIIS